MTPQETMHREVTKKERYFSCELREGEEVKLFVEGVEQVSFVAPIDGAIDCYLRGRKWSVQFQ